MEKLHDSLLLRILSQLDDSADVARCRVASKAFNVVFPGLRSINLRCTETWYSRAWINHRIRSFMTVFLDLISKLQTVESICIELSFFEGERDLSDVFYVTDDDFAKVWLPRVSGSLKSLSIIDDRNIINNEHPRNFLSLVSKLCHNLVNLDLRFGWLSVDGLNPMPSLTSLTLAHLYLQDEHLNELNKCFTNLLVLKLVDVLGLTHPKIHLLNLKTCLWNNFDEDMPPLTIITPNLNTLTINCCAPRGFHIEAPMLSHFRLSIDSYVYLLEPNTFEVKTLWLEAFDIGSFLSRLPITKMVETLTLDTENVPRRDYTGSEFTLGKVFTVFPNLSSLCIKPGGWLELEAWLNPQSWEILYGGWEEFSACCSGSCSCCLNSDTGLEKESRMYPQAWEISDGMNGLKRICAYLMLADPSLTFSFLAFVLDQCVGLLEVSLLIHSDVDCTISESFMSKCVARRPGLKWRWGIWSKNKKDSWITDAISN